MALRNAGVPPAAWPVEWQAEWPGDLDRREPVPVLPALRPVVPGGGLRPGSVVGVDSGPGSASLGLALVAGVATAGGWGAVVGLPEFGVPAAIGMGADPARLLLVDEPGGRWADVVATLTEAVELVLVRPPEEPSPALVRRLTALARRHRCVLAVDGPWTGTTLRLRVDTAEWTGLGDGHGHLRGRRALVVAEGRGAAAAGLRTWLWLPAADGTVTPGTPVERTLEVVA